MMHHLAHALACWMCALRVFYLSEHCIARSFRVIFINMLLVLLLSLVTGLFALVLLLLNQL
jgi:hypothetical protein